MYMSVATRTDAASVYAELAGARILITGLTADLGVDIARAFADHRARLVLQSADASPAVAELAAILAESASDMKLFLEAPLDRDSAVRFAQAAAATFGGLDAVVNLVTIRRSDLAGLASLEACEAFIADKMIVPTLVGRVAANRMRLTWTEGLVLNVIVVEEPANAAEAALAGLVRAALAALTRGEADDWADKAIRFNAIGPKSHAAGESAGATLGSEPDIAALALYLAAKRGRSLSGHVFDAEGVARRGC